MYIYVTASIYIYTYIYVSYALSALYICKDICVHRQSENRFKLKLKPPIGLHTYVHGYMYELYFHTAYACEPRLIKGPPLQTSYTLSPHKTNDAFNQCSPTDCRAICRFRAVSVFPKTRSVMKSSCHPIWGLASLLYSMSMIWYGYPYPYPYP